MTAATATTAVLVRKLVVEVLEARDLLPKDGQGSSSPYVIVDFDGQRRRTQTKVRDLNPQWNEALEFVVLDPNTMEAEKLELEVYNDKRFGNARRNHFLGRVIIYGTQFSRKGDAGVIYYPLDRKSLFSWMRGEIGLRIYYSDEEEQPPQQEPPPPEQQQPQQPPTPPPIPPVPTEEALLTQEQQNPPIIVVQEVPMYYDHHAPPYQPPPTMQADHPPSYQPPQVVQSDHPPPHQQPQVVQSDHPPPYQPPPVVDLQQHHHHQPPPQHPAAEVLKVQTLPPGSGDRVRVVRKPNGDFAPRVISGRFTAETERMQAAHDLVEPMQYLFVRIVKARGISGGESPYVKIRTGSHSKRSKPAAHLRAGEPPGNPDWNQVFSLAHNRPGDSTGDTLEVSVWDGRSDAFLGGVCLDLSDVPVRDPPDSPLASQWYHLEGGDGVHPVTGDIMLSVWLGTQADDTFAESWCSDAPYTGHTRSKVYQSPKLWYLRATIIEAQDLPIAAPTTAAPDVRITARLGFQSLRTRRSVTNHRSSFYWHEDLVFVASEPLEDELFLLVEDRSTTDPSLLARAIVPIHTIEQRLDERQVGAKWIGLDGGENSYGGRIHVRLCLEGGYHVLEEAAHVCSDFRPTAKQLWKPPVGVLELGILGARGLLPMKTKGGAKGSTDAYCVAKYGKKWVRTRTITDNFDPRWNEQYTWQVYDPCTVLTLGVFDNWRMFADVADVHNQDFRIGKVRIRVSSLENNRVYTNSYPLLVLLRSGVKKMGEVELAVRFVCPSLLPDTCAVYGQPPLPRMHYIRPLGVAQQEMLRGAATKMVVYWLARAEPPLGEEVVRFMLDADSHAWSMRRSKANWFRIMAVLGWAIGLARWVDDIRRWRNPLTTVLVHILYLVLVWYPDLIVPTVFLYVFLIGAWYYRFRPRIPAGMDVRLSQADTVDPDELDEEFDRIPSERAEELVRMRYDRLRTLAGRVQRVLGDLATQGERVQALVSWRDPRATRLFIGACLGVALVMYIVPAKMVAVALGFYFLRHPMFRDSMPPATLNFFRRLPSLSDRLI